MSQSVLRPHPLDDPREDAVRAYSLTADDRARLRVDEAERLDRLIAFDPDSEDGWEDWPHEHYPGECCPLFALEEPGAPDDAFEHAFGEWLNHQEPKRAPR